MLTLMIYPKCSTCKNAVKWLEENGVAHETRHIVENPLTAEEIKAIHEKTGLPLKKFFNTSGIKYRELGLKDKIPTLTTAEQYDLLATDGMLVKRPLGFDDLGKITVGFKVADFEETWLT